MALKQVTIGSTIYRLEESQPTDKVVAGDKAHHTQLVSYDAASGKCRILVDGVAYQVLIDHQYAGQLDVQFGLHGPIIAVHTAKVSSTLQPNTPRIAQTRAHGVHKEHAHQLACPLSGKVLTILCQPGQEVSKGKALVIIESMKMENEICAPFDACVKNICVQRGSVVQKGQVLIEFERKGDE